LPDTRDVGDAIPDLSATLFRNGILVEESIVLDDVREVGVATADRLRTRYHEPAIGLTTSAPPSGWARLVLSVDEFGIATWNLSDSATRAESTTEVRELGMSQSFLIRHRAPSTREISADGRDDVRGPIGWVGKKVLDVLAFPLIDPVFGAIGEGYSTAWEKAFRPYRLRTFTPTNYRSSQVETFGDREWDRLTAGRTLLLIHGTFSRAHEAFRDFPDEYVADLHRLYEGRVFAFDHFTISHDPRKNVDWIVQQVPEGLRLKLDILCHSRGGLVARSLTEKQSELSLGSRTISIERVVHVGTPNAGTPLTDAPHMTDLVDAYTNFLVMIPDSPSSLLLDCLLVVVKHLAAETLKGLEGLQSMLPSGRFLREWLNLGTAPARYHALASSYRPTAPGPLSWTTDRLFTRIFRGEASDLVVPTSGVYQQNGCDAFPIPEARRMIFNPEDGVSHFGYFAEKRARDSILHWLSQQ
jgi:hypothetical protein